ncbi:hypothetical protein GpartN1_g4185.t1 [Galdieria partita]|uniref:Uncharacterized protein n=1 Tax=Galdieria partita TaxID=83374 RepID=A0A9C7PYA3_9RHOD|nr:hypothetical protein GpartN1_g4185.t1 [Galdieria partita]
MFEEHGKTPVSWDDYKCTNTRLLVETTVEGFSLRLLHHEVVAEWLLCRQETAVPATAIDEATCFLAKSQGIISTNSLVMLQPIGMVDSILLGYSFSETHGLNSPSSAVPTCRRFVFDTANWEYLELFWFSNSTVTASWMKFFPDGKRTRYFVLYEAPPEGKLPYKLLQSFELIGYRTTLPEVSQKQNGIQDNLPELFYDKTWRKNKEATRKSFQLLQQLYIGEYRGNQRFTQYEVRTGHILEEHTNSFYSCIEPLERSLVELEKVKEMQRLCFLPRARGSELSYRLHELMVEAGILLEYFGPDHTINEEARQKRLARRLAKRKRTTSNESGRHVDLLENAPTKMLQKMESCNKNYWDRVVSQKESNQSYSSDWKRRMTQCTSRSSSPGLSQSSFSTQNNQRKRTRDGPCDEHNTHPYKRENVEHVDSQVSITTTDNLTWMSNNSISQRHKKIIDGDSFDPSQVTEEPSERNRVNLMLGPYGYIPSSSIQGNMIGFSDEKERIWMFSTTEPECRVDSSIPLDDNEKGEIRHHEEMAQFYSQKEEDWTIANDELYRLGEEWPSPFLQSTQVDQSFSNSSPSLEPLSNNPLWNGSFYYEWPEDMLYASSESSSDWFIKTLALEDSHGMRSWKEMDSGVAQVEEIEKQSWPSQWIREEDDDDVFMHWTIPSFDLNQHKHYKE